MYNEIRRRVQADADIMQKLNSLTDEFGVTFESLTASLGRIKQNRNGKRSVVGFVTKPEWVVAGARNVAAPVAPAAPYGPAVAAAPVMDDAADAPVDPAPVPAEVACNRTISILKRTLADLELDEHDHRDKIIT